MPTDQLIQIACQQVLVEDSSVFSIQWLDLPAELADGITPETVLQQYLTAIHQLTFRLIRPDSADGEVRFLLFGQFPLLCFTGPLPEGSGLALRICGGLLVQQDQCDRGELLFQCEQLPDNGLRIILRLSDYCPLLLGSRRPSYLRRWLYRLTQATLHKLVTVRFFALLYRKLGGRATRIKTVPVEVIQGRKT